MPAHPPAHTTHPSSPDRTPAGRRTPDPLTADAMTADAMTPDPAVPGPAGRRGTAGTAS